jgi:5,10-methylenetetrahydromethanopterin reductase
VLAMREAITIIRGLLKGETIDFQGEILSFHAGKLNFEPVRADLPIYIASNGPLGQVLGGRIADGVIMEGCGTPEEAKVFVSRVRGAAREAGRDPEGVLCIARLNCCIAEDSMVAHDTLRLRAAKTIAGGYLPFVTLGELGLALPPEALEKVAGLAYNVGFGPYEQILPWVGNGHVDAVTLAGTAVEIASRVSALRENGIDNVIISPAPAPGGSSEAVIRSFAEEVWPAASLAQPLHQHSSSGVAL